jgi:hypothetical protein
MAKKKDFDGDPGGLIGDAIFSVIKPIYKEGEKAKRFRTRSTRTRYYDAPEPKVSQKEIVFSVLDRAITRAGRLFSARDLYYATRPLAYANPDWEDGKELKYPYFSQTLLTEYQEQYGTIPGLWRDPRGQLHEPHTGASLALGTREVASYQFPEYSFDKILYVEKEGEWPKLQAARLAERYDMAVASAKGYPVEAVRELFARAEGGDYQLFVFHDADIDGYEIARVLREATKRMPNHNVDVVDIGLTVEDAVALDLDSEPYYRKNGLPLALRRRLSDLEREYFRGKVGERFELNAILPDTRRIEYIERKLEENGVRGKVIPPDDKLSKLTDKTYREHHAAWVEEVLHDLVSLDDMKKALADEFVERFELEHARRYIEEEFEKDKTLSWREALKNKLAATQKEHFEHALKAAVRERVVETLKASPGGSA